MARPALPLALSPRPSLSLSGTSLPLEALEPTSSSRLRAPCIAYAPPRSEAARVPTLHPAPVAELSSPLRSTPESVTCPCDRYAALPVLDEAPRRRGDCDSGHRVQSLFEPNTGHVPRGLDRLRLAPHRAGPDPRSDAPQAPHRHRPQAHGKPLGRPDDGVLAAPACDTPKPAPCPFSFGLIRQAFRGCSLGARTEAVPRGIP